MHRHHRLLTADSSSEFKHRIILPAVLSTDPKGLEKRPDGKIAFRLSCRIPHRQATTQPVRALGDESVRDTIVVQAELARLEIEGYSIGGPEAALLQVRK